MNKYYVFYSLRIFLCYVKRGYLMERLHGNVHYNCFGAYDRWDVVVHGCVPVGPQGLKGLARRKYGNNGDRGERGDGRVYPVILQLKYMGEMQDHLMLVFIECKIIYEEINASQSERSLKGLRDAIKTEVCSNIKS
nr:hypothetical protein [Borrelia hermsii]